MTGFELSLPRMVCTSCGAETNANCNCGVAYLAKSVRAADAIRANPGRSNVAIAEVAGLSEATVRRARQRPGSSNDDPEERVGRDGKSYSLRQRVTDDPDIPPRLAHAAAATDRRCLTRREGSVVPGRETESGSPPMRKLISRQDCSRKGTPCSNQR